MNIFPYYRTEIILSATPKQLVEHLQNYIEPWDPIAIYRQHKLFRGAISDSGFNMTHIPMHRNSFGPTVYGKFIPVETQTKIIIESRPQALFYPTIIFMFLFTLLVSWNTFWGSDTAQSLTILIPIGTVFIFYIVVWAAFETGTDYIINEFKKITKEFSDHK